ncbi:MAG: NAD(P)/FAD-dependent oxidoreductase [Caulobacterales bacterium]
MPAFDYLICGSGIAGASIASELAAHGRVLVTEQEDSHGYHTTGRSAAMYIESYGNAPVRMLTAASRAFFDAPTPGFCDYPLLTPRGCLNIASTGQLAEVDALAEEIRLTGTAFRVIGGGEARAMVPVLRPEAVARAVFEPNACDIDTNGLHAGFLRLAKARGAEFRLNARIEHLDRSGEAWRAGLAGGEAVQARVIVNAAGAWCDRLAAIAGASPLGLTPMRRTAIIIDPPANTPFDQWPTVSDVSERFYFKPQSGRILASPADETPSEPVDAAPEELDIALCIDRVQAAADIPVRRVVRAWAGLRTFAPDRTPVIGYDAETPAFFWFAGQGGYGMQTSPAAARLGGVLARGLALPGDLADFGVTARAFSPKRFAAALPR